MYPPYRISRHIRLLVGVGLGLLVDSVGWGQDAKKAEPVKRPPPPVLLLSSPNTLSLPPRPSSTPAGIKANTPAENKPIKLLLRGRQLDTVAEARLAPECAPGEPPSTESGNAPLAGISVKITSKKKSPPDNNQHPAERFGDSELQVEFTLPPELDLPTAAPAGILPILVAGPGGVSGPLWLLVGPPSGVELTAEKEPNDGFRQAQPQPLPGAVDGQIARGQDVDVYRIVGSAGQRVRLELLAARHGSLLDGRLMVYDSRGRELAAADDNSETGVDPWLELVCPADGVLMVVVSDAHETGGVFHNYRLLAKLATNP